MDGVTLQIEKTLGSVPLNKLTLPTININFIDNTPYYRSIDDCVKFVDTNTTFKTINSCIIRYTVAASNITSDTTETLTYKTGTNTYTLNRVPVIDINSVGSYVKNTDYKLCSDHTTIEWIGNKPSNNSTFTVNYKWINTGYFVSHYLLDYLMKDVIGRVSVLFKDYNINIIDFKSVKDLSDIYASDAFNAFSFDFIITYPFTWSIAISEEDAVIANTFTFDLIVNNINTNTISYTKNQIGG